MGPSLLLVLKAFVPAAAGEISCNLLTFAPAAPKAQTSTNLRSLLANCRLKASASQSSANRTQMVIISASKLYLKLDGEHRWASSHSRILAISSDKRAGRGTLTTMVRMTVPSQRRSRQRINHRSSNFRPVPCGASRPPQRHCCVSAASAAVEKTAWGVARLRLDATPANHPA